MVKKESRVLPMRIEFKFKEALNIYLR
ncbi:uncharacterized protein METZ01_LOCUS327521 [marine metagenome]|uniref:Uncharacterized protein n=1 Tax=marine metagenome TaxID=408172 RepID=A0A382PPA8_9ZZZZ